MKNKQLIMGVATATLAAAILAAFILKSRQSEPPSEADAGSPAAQKQQPSLGGSYSASGGTQTPAIPKSEAAKRLSDAMDKVQVASLVGTLFSAFERGDKVFIQRLETALKQQPEFTREEISLRLSKNGVSSKIREQVETFLRELE